MRLNHIRPYFEIKIKIVNKEECECREVETLDHIILECKKYEMEEKFY